MTNRLPIGCAVLTAGVAALLVIAAATFIDSGDQPARAAQPTAERTASMTDPRGGLPYGVHLSRSNSGAVCALLGKRAGGGFVDPATGAPYRPGPGEGSCVKPTRNSRDLQIRRDYDHYPDTGRTRDQATIIWGTTARSITRVTVAPDERGPVNVSVSKRTFGTALEGVIAGRLVVTAHRRDGTRSRTVLPAVPAAWKRRLTNPEGPTPTP